MPHLVCQADDLKEQVQVLDAAHNGVVDVVQVGVANQDLKA